MAAIEFRDQYPSQEQAALHAAGQTVVIEAVRHYIEEMKARPPILDGRPVETGQLVGHLMAAEVLLGQVARAFSPA